MAAAFFAWTSFPFLPPWFQVMSISLLSPSLISLLITLISLYLFPNAWFFQLKNPLYLNLKGCYFRGPIPIFNNATKLRYFDLSANSCNSSIPDWIYFCTHLEFLDLSGTISTAIANLTSLKTLSVYLNKLSGEIPKDISHLSDNNYNGSIPDSFGNVPDCLESLGVLSFANNQLSGAIPTNLGKLLGLRELYLYDNKFTGNLPEWLGQLVNLQILSIQDNMLRGDVTESHFANLTKLEVFSSSAENKSQLAWIPPFQLRKLGLGSWALRSPCGFRSREILRSLIYLIPASQVAFLVGFGRWTFWGCLITISLARYHT